MSETRTKPKIFIFVNGGMGREPIGAAIAEDGTYLGGHWSSNESFLRHDMGLTSDWHHKQYRAHYPDGFELVDMIGAEPENHPEWAAALALANARSAKEPAHA